MGKRNRGRGKLDVPLSEYTDAEGNVLTLRGTLPPAARREYAETLAPHGGAQAGSSGRPAASREDAWHRAQELLFERLAVRWVIADAPIDRPRELLGRLRVATSAERAWVREVLREHCEEHFPDVEAP